MGSPPATAQADTQIPPRLDVYGTADRRAGFRGLTRARKVRVLELVRRCHGPAELDELWLAIGHVYGLQVRGEIPPGGGKPQGNGHWRIWLSGGRTHTVLINPEPESCECGAGVCVGLFIALLLIAR